MVNVQFDDPNIGFQTSSLREEKSTGLIGFLINQGLAKDAKVANIILIITLIVCFGVMFFTVRSMFGGAKPPAINPEVIQQMQHLPPVI